VRRYRVPSVVPKDRHSRGGPVASRGMHGGPHAAQGRPRPTRDRRNPGRRIPDHTRRHPFPGEPQLRQSPRRVLRGASGRSSTVRWGHVGPGAQREAHPVTAAARHHPVRHPHAALALMAMDHGKMDGFNLITGCSGRKRYPCYTQSFQSQIPNLWDLAGHFVVADHIFEDYPTPSWASHMVLASSSLDGFLGESPTTSRFTWRRGPNWGCDSYRDARWWNGHTWIDVPSCIPDRRGRGPYRDSPVKYVPTIFDRLQSAGLTWKIYGGSGERERSLWVGLVDLPDLLRMPWVLAAQEPRRRRRRHDGCPFRHAPQPGHRDPILPQLAAQQGLHDGRGQLDRVGGLRDRERPRVGVDRNLHHLRRLRVLLRSRSPSVAQAGHAAAVCDREPVRQSGVHRPHSREHRLDLGVRGTQFRCIGADAQRRGAYDFSNSFDYSQPPLPGVPMVETPVPKSELAYIAAHPPSPDDPT
jgi:hypothetical protein